MKTLLISIFVLITLNVSAQNFRKDWTFFRLRTGWYLNFSKDKTPYIGKNTQGHMTFTSSKDSTLKVVYYIYQKTDMDTAFTKEIYTWRMIQACWNSFSNGDKSLMSFDIGDYHYLMESCPKCDAKKNKDCEMLAQDILDFINNK